MENGRGGFEKIGVAKPIYLSEVRVRRGEKYPPNMVKHINRKEKHVEKLGRLFGTFGPSKHDSHYLISSFGWII